MTRQRNAKIEDENLSRADQSQLKITTLDQTNLIFIKNNLIRIKTQ